MRCRIGYRVISWTRHNNKQELIASVNRYTGYAQWAPPHLSIDVGRFNLTGESFAPDRFWEQSI